MTTIYLDTEFNGHHGELISMALVAFDPDRIWYEVAPLPAHTAIWVQEHVIPVLGKFPIRSFALFKLSFQQFISQFQNPTIICDWHADAEHFCSMLSGTDYGSSLDFACTIKILKTPQGEPVSTVPHNALADATALAHWHQTLNLGKSHV